MSDGTINLRLTELRTAAPQFDSTADAVQRTLSTLQASLSAETECWGSGDVGSAFAQHYLPHRGQSQANLTTLVAALRDTGQAVADATDAFEETEQHNTDAFVGPMAPR